MRPVAPTNRRSGAVRLVLLVVLAVVVAATGALVAPASADLSQDPPRTAVAIGDSFISGEGAGDYRPVTDIDGVAQDFPGWRADNADAFFCHRSANASIEVADLPGIDQRVNLACSGAQPHDLADASAERDDGRRVDAQLDQLREVAAGADIDLVLVGIGSNNSSFTFGSAVSACVGSFLGDAWTGWWEFWADWFGSLDEDPCTNDDLATAAQLQAAEAETLASVRLLMDTLDDVDADGEHRVVLQTYTNPIAPTLADEFLREDGRSDTRDKFRGLGRERFAAGCPIHVASLPAGIWLSEGLGDLVAGVADGIRANDPDADIAVLDVQQAFDGARMCEQSTSPDATLATPVILQDKTWWGAPTGRTVTSLDGYDKIRLNRLNDTCDEWFQTCQESLHPNADGHAVLGRCLSDAWASSEPSLACQRAPDGDISTSTP